MKSFETLYGKIKKTKDDRMTYCETCGEPSRNKLCRKCNLLKN